MLEKKEMYLYSLDFRVQGRLHFLPIQADSSLEMMNTGGSMKGYLILKVAVMLKQLD